MLGVYMLEFIWVREVLMTSISLLRGDGKFLNETQIHIGELRMRKLAVKELFFDNGYLQNTRSCIGEQGQRQEAKTGRDISSPRKRNIVFMLEENHEKRESDLEMKRTELYSTRNAATSYDKGKQKVDMVNHVSERSLPCPLRIRCMSGATNLFSTPPIEVPTIDSILSTFKITSYKNLHYEPIAATSVATMRTQAESSGTTTLAASFSIIAARTYIQKSWDISTGFAFDDQHNLCNFCTAQLP